MCLLCKKPYCDAHKGMDEGVCETGHLTCYSKPDEHARVVPIEVFQSAYGEQSKSGNGQGGLEAVGGRFDKASFYLALSTDNARRRERRERRIGMTAKSFGCEADKSRRSCG